RMVGLVAGGDETTPGLGNEVVGGMRVGMCGVVPQGRIGTFAGRPLADDQQVSRVVGVDEQLVAQVPVVAGHVAPDGFGDGKALGGRSRWEAGLPDRVDRHRSSPPRRCWASFFFCFSYTARGRPAPA